MDERDTRRVISLELNLREMLDRAEYLLERTKDQEDTQQRANNMDAFEKVIINLKASITEMDGLEL